VRSPSWLPITLSLGLALGCTTRADDGEQPEFVEPTWPELRSELPHDANPSLAVDEQADFARDGRTFALDLYHQLRSEPGFDAANIVFSPVSLRTALGMAWAGADAESPTHEELADIMNFTLPELRQHVASNWLDDALRSRELEADETEGNEKDPVILAPINAVWIEQLDAPDIEPEYLDLLAVHYDSGVRLADFLADKGREVARVNAWVEARTRGLIPELITAIPEFLSKIEINAFYLKAPWATQFEGATLTEPFVTAGGATLNVDMMSSAAMDVGYALADDHMIVALPLRNRDLELIALMPTGDFAEFEAGLDEPKLAAALASLDSAYVAMHFPKLDVDVHAMLKASLQALRPGNTFEALGVFEIFHQIKIIADEDGVEAAAATAVVYEDEVGGGAEQIVRVDRAFFLMIRDRPTDQLLFFGRVLDPSGAAG
jgi:serpin B